jgi:hypothetical protein
MYQWNSNLRYYIWQASISDYITTRSKPQRNSNLRLIDMRWEPARITHEMRTCAYYYTGDAPARITHEMHLRVLHMRCMITCGNYTWSCVITAGNYIWSCVITAGNYIWLPANLRLLHMRYMVTYDYMRSSRMTCIEPKVTTRVETACGYSASAGTSYDTELEKLKKRLQFVMYCIDCFVSWKKNWSLTLLDFKSLIPDSCFVPSGTHQ